jgi:hypothetical protein
MNPYDSSGDWDADKLQVVPNCSMYCPTTTALDTVPFSLLQTKQKNSEGNIVLE